MQARMGSGRWAGVGGRILVVVGMVMTAIGAFTAAATTPGITVDGFADDWATLAGLEPDAVGDALGSIDIVGVAALANDESVYVLVVFEGDVSLIQQIDCDFAPSSSALPAVHATVRPSDGEFHVTYSVGGELTDLGAMGAYAMAEAFELRLPRLVFDGGSPPTVSIRLIDCEYGKEKPADTTSAIEVADVSGSDLPFQTQARPDAADSLFCHCTAAEGVFPEVDSVWVSPGYRAEYFIAPSGLNTPSDVVVLPDGRVLVPSSRSGVILEVLPDGGLTTFAEGHVYAIDCDREGNVYGYNFPSGQIFAIEENRAMRFVTRVPDTACESTLAVAPDGTLYIGHNACSGDTSGQSTIYRIAGEGEPTVLTTELDGVSALDVDRDGTLYAAAGDGLYAVDVDTGAVVRGSILPFGVSFHGLVVGEDAAVYVSSGDFDDEGGVYRIAVDGTPVVLAWFSGNGIEGIAVTDDGAIVGTQRSIGGLQRVAADGTVTALVEPNGLVSPHSVAIALCGELIVVNDEGGRLTIACPDGLNRPLMPVISFQPPQTHIAFSQEGWFVCGESAPGFPSHLNLYLPNGQVETLATDLDNVSGVAVGVDGAIYAAATGAGMIVRIQPDGTRTVIAEGLESPQALAVTPNGTVYAVTGGAGFGEVFAVPPFGDTIVVITPDGATRQLARIEQAAALAFGPNGDLYVAAGSAVFCVDAWGTAVPFAQGFQAARGVAFDAEGRLYVADDDANAIVRIVRIVPAS